MIRAIILAAGLSRRMGEENKLLLPFGGSTIIETTINNILKADLDEIVVVIGHEAEKVLPLLNKNYLLSTEPLDDSKLKIQNSKLDKTLSIVLNSEYKTGMTSSIQAGVHVAETEETHYMICLSDMVLIQPQEYQFLVNEFLNLLKHNKKAILVPIFQGKKGNPVIFSHFYKNDILNLSYTEGCKPIVQAHANSVYFIEMPTDSILRDIDNREDYDNIVTL